jgi:hypothetical protein
MRPRGMKKTRTRVAGHQNCGICHDQEPETFKARARAEDARLLAEDLVPAVASHFRCSACMADAYVALTHASPTCAACGHFPMVVVNGAPIAPRGVA